MNGSYRPKQSKQLHSQSRAVYTRLEKYVSLDVVYAFCVAYGGVSATVCLETACVLTLMNTCLG